MPKKKKIVMNENRIWFHNNPWSEGHPIEELVWSARRVGEDVWFDFHIQTDNYFAERDIEEDEEEEYDSCWESPGVWANYGRCTLSSTQWHRGGFKVCHVDEYSADYLDGINLTVDNDPKKEEEWDARAFHIYLLGHDAVAHHSITFVRQGNSHLFNIHWAGCIAQAYIGHDEFDRTFEMDIHGQPLPEVTAAR